MEYIGNINFYGAILNGPVQNLTSQDDARLISANQELTWVFWSGESEERALAIRDRLHPNFKRGGRVALRAGFHEWAGAHDSPVATEKQAVLILQPTDLIHWGMERPKSSHPDAAQDRDAKEGEDTQFKRAFPCFCHDGFRIPRCRKSPGQFLGAKFTPHNAEDPKLKRGEKTRRGLGA